MRKAQSRQSAGAHGVRLRAERHRHAALEPGLRGQLGELPQTLQPLEPLKDDILLLGNLTHNTGRALLDGAGDHGRCCGSYLTGVQVKKTVSDIKASVSCDQLVANQIGSQTRFPSLEVGLEDARQAGDCDSGYSCAYTNNLAWRSETQPLPPILDPRALFERLFGDGAELTPEARARRRINRRSILDFVTRRHAGAARQPRPDRSAQARRVPDARSARSRSRSKRAEQENAQVDPGMEKPYGVPSDFAEHFRLMTDMITVAFQADLTRVVTFLVTREGTSRAYREIGIPDGHHPLTHHRNMREHDGQGRADQPVPRSSSSRSGSTKLKAAQEGDGSLLDNSMIVYGAGLSDGNAHTHHDLPTLIAGARRQLHQDRPPRRLSQGNADVQPVPDDDGPDGHADGSLRRRDRTSERAGPDLAGRW